MDVSPADSSIDRRADWNRLLIIYNSAASRGCEEQQLFAINALRRLCSIAPDDAINKTVVNLVRSIESSFLHVTACRNDGSVGASVGESGGIAALLRMLQRNTPDEHKIIFAECLRNLLELQHENRLIFAKIGGIAVIANIIPLSSEKTKVYLLEILSAALLWVDAIRDFAFAGEIWRFLLEALLCGSMASRARAARAIGLMTTSREIVRLLVFYGVVPALLDLMRADDQQARLVAANSLGLIACDLDHRRLVAEAGAIPLYAELLEGENRQGKEIAVDVLRVLSAVEEICIQICKHLLIIIRGKNEETKFAAVKVLWGVPWCEHSASALGQTGAVHCLLKVFQEHGEEDTGMWALGILVEMSHRKSDRRALADQGLISVLTNLTKNGSERMRDSAVEALENFYVDPRFHDRVSHLVDDHLFQAARRKLAVLRDFAELGLG